MKFHGKIGFYEGTAEVPNSGGVYRPNIVERNYKGDILEYRQQFQSTDKQNDNLTIRNKFSILADLYLKQHLSSIRYVEFQGIKWKITNITVGYPRIIFEVGGVYNDNTTRTT